MRRAVTAIDVPHAVYEHGRRVGVLAGLLGAQLMEGWSVVSLGTRDEVIVRIIANEMGCRVVRLAGDRLPYPDRCFDAVLLVDALRGASDPAALLRDAARVARSAVVIKDRGASRVAWDQALVTAGLTIASWTRDVPLSPLSWLFGRHVVLSAVHT